MSITSSKDSFGTQFKAHIVTNRAARHLRLNTLEKEPKKKIKIVQGILPSTVSLNLDPWRHRIFEFVPNQNIYRLGLL